jgi:hypothetical protein
MPTSKLENLSVLLTLDLQKRSISALKYILTKLPNQANTELLHSISDFPYSVLIFLCQNSPDFELLCQQNSLILKHFQQQLKAAGHPSIELKSLDGKMQYSIFELYIAASFMNNFNSTKSSADRETALNNACALGLFDALLIRCMTHEKILKNPAKSPAAKEQALKNILHDLHQITNLYLAYGYIQAGFVLNSLGAYFIENNDEARGITFFEESVKYFLRAFFLKDNPYSNEILSNLTHRKSLLDIFQEQNLQFENWDEAKTTFREWMGERYNSIESLAKSE